MTETINTIEDKEMNTLIEKAKEAYAAINQQETKIGKNIYDLGETLNDLNIKANSNGEAVEGIAWYKDPDAPSSQPVLPVPMSLP